jgi:hypothetical protein
MEAVAWPAIGLLAATLFGNPFCLSSRIDGLGSRIDALATKMDSRFDALDARLDDHLRHHI